MNEPKGPCITIDPAMVSSEEMAIRQREELADEFHEMIQENSWICITFWLPDGEKEQWKVLFEQKGFAVENLFVDSPDQQYSLYEVKIKQQRKEIEPKVMKRSRTEPVDEEAAAEDPWIWVDDTIPTNEDMKTRKRNDLSDFFAKEMVEKPSPWTFWFPVSEESEWKKMFESKGFIVQDQFNEMKKHPMGGRRRLYKVKINPKKKQKTDSN